MQSSTPAYPGHKPSPYFSINESPGNRLLNCGPQALTPVEVLATLLNDGNRWQNALCLADCLLTRFGGFCGLYAADDSQILKVKGVSRAKLARIRATLELNRLYLSEEMKQSPDISKPNNVYNLIRCSITEPAKEEAWLLLLNYHNKLIESVHLTKGKGNYAAIDPREIGRHIFNYWASTLIFAHTHPSGNPTPSEEDRTLTRKMVIFCTAINVRFLDHVIVGQAGYFSFKESGYLNAYCTNEERRLPALRQLYQLKGKGAADDKAKSGKKGAL